MHSQNSVTRIVNEEEILLFVTYNVEPHTSNHSGCALNLMGFHIVSHIQTSPLSLDM